MSERLPLARLGERTPFRADRRFAAAEEETEPQPQPLQEATFPDPQQGDPLADAYAQGYADGAGDVRVETLATAAADAQAGGTLQLAFARLDRALEEQLRDRLRATVAALCEAALAPLALDVDLLERRVAAAAAMLARADDARVIRLHPDDIKLLTSRMRVDWEVLADPSLERGAIRVEGTSGGVEDGPATWRKAIAEALARC
jgi:flagellar assembly protein FliH